MDCVVHRFLLHHCHHHLHFRLIAIILTDVVVADVAVAVAAADDSGDVAVADENASISPEHFAWSSVEDERWACVFHRPPWK